MAFFDRLRRLFGGERNPAGGNGNGAGPSDASVDRMITCEQALTFVNEFLDGELDGATAEKVEAHFEVCGRCYPHLRMEEAFRTAVRRAGAGKEAPPELRDRVRRLIRDAAED